MRLTGTQGAKATSSEKAEGKSVSATFGYYPLACDIETDKFSIRTLPGHDSIVAAIEKHPNIVDGWIYPGPQRHQDLATGMLSMRPFSSRVFGLPKTHALTIRGSTDPADLDFAIWCLSFIKGIRLTTTEAGFLDATPISPAKLVDFIDSASEGRIIDVALDYTEHNRGFIENVKAAINALFISQNPQNFSFERFQYLYMSIDSIYNIMNKIHNINCTHRNRISKMCSILGMHNLDCDIHKERNETFHEARFFSEPLGFAIDRWIGPDEKEAAILLQMKALICRFMVAILIDPSIDYVKTPINTRDYFGLEFPRIR